MCLKHFVGNACGLLKTFRRKHFCGLLKHFVETHLAVWTLFLSTVGCPASPFQCRLSKLRLCAWLAWRVPPYPTSDQESRCGHSCMVVLLSRQSSTCTLRTSGARQLAMTRIHLQLLLLFRLQGVSGRMFLFRLQGLSGRMRFLRTTCALKSPRLLDAIVFCGIASRLLAISSPSNPCCAMCCFRMALVISELPIVARRAGRSYVNLFTFKFTTVQYYNIT